MKRQHGLTPMQRVERRRTITPAGCWETSFLPNKTYPSLKIAGRHVLVHRIAYEHFKGPIPEGMLVCHQCDNPRCHNPEHLFLGTYLDNILDMCTKGRNGVRPPSPHTGAVIEMAALGQTEIANKLGIDQSTVSVILRKAGLSRGRTTPFGKARVGEAHGRALLTEDAVRAIRKDDRTAKVLAALHGVSASTITAVKLRTNWNHVPD